MRTTYVMAGMALVFSVGCSQPPDTTYSEPPPEVPIPVVATPSISIADSLSGAREGNFAEQFKLQDVRSLVFAVDVDDADGVQFLKLDVLSPSGSLYTSLWRAFSTTASPGQTAQPPGGGVDMPVDMASSEAGMTRVYVIMPVAGSRLLRYGLKGDFGVQAFIGDSTTAAATTTVSLTR